MRTLRVEGLPVLRDRAYDNFQEAIRSQVNYVVIQQDPDTAFDPNLLVYDRDYQNE